MGEGEEGGEEEEEEEEINPAAKNNPIPTNANFVSFLACVGVTVLTSPEGTVETDW